MLLMRSSLHGSSMLCNGFSVKKKKKSSITTVQIFLVEGDIAVAINALLTFKLEFEEIKLFGCAFLRNVSCFESYMQLNLQIAFAHLLIWSCPDMILQNALQNEVFLFSEKMLIPAISVIRSFMLCRL